METKPSKLHLFFRKKVLSLFCRFRCFGLGVMVIDRSVYWTLISYRKLFWEFLKRGKILLQINDVTEWGWVATSGNDIETFKEKYSDSVIYGICDTFQILPWEIEQLDPENLKPVVDSYRIEFLKYYNTLIFLKKRVRLKKVIYAQGYMPGADACRQFSLRTGIKRLAIENVADKRKILWDDVSGIAVNKTLAKNYYYGFENVVDAEMAIKYACRKTAKIRQSKVQEHISGNQLCDDSGFILFLGQVYTDTSILFSVQEGWGPIDVLEALKTEALKHKLGFKVKLHPKEYAGKSSLAKKMYNSLTYKKMRENPGLVDEGIQVDYNNSLDTYDLIKKAVLVVTMNSQAGLEAALFGKPVICCTKSNYSDLGITLDCGNRKELEMAVENGLNLKEAERLKMHERACKFDYIFNEIYCIPKTITSLTEKACR